MIDPARQLDAALMARVAEGDSAAIAELQSRFGAAMVGKAWRMLRPCEVDDALQLAMIRLWRYAGKYRSQIPLSAWVMREARQAFLCVVRRRRPRAAEAFDGVASSRDSAAAEPREQAAAVLARAATIAGARELRALRLVYVHGLSLRQAEAEMGLRFGGAASAIGSATRRLRQDAAAMFGRA